LLPQGTVRAGSSKACGPTKPFGRNQLRSLLAINNAFLGPALEALEQNRAIPPHPPWLGLLSGTNGIKACCSDKGDNPMTQLSQSSLPLEPRIADVLDYLQHQFSNYPFNPRLDTNFIIELAADFQDLNLLEQIKTFRWYYDDDLSKVGNARAALRRWMARTWIRSR
jgi:hypothetical protein